MTFKPNVGLCTHCGHDHFNRECPTCHDADGPCRALLQWEARVFRANLESKVNAALVDLKRPPTAQFMQEPTPEKRDLDPDAMAAAVQRGRLEERGDVVAWLTEAQYHVVTKDEVAVIAKLKHQFSRSLHERRSAGRGVCDND